HHRSEDERAERLIPPLTQPPPRLGDARRQLTRHDASGPPSGGDGGPLLLSGGPRRAAGASTGQEHATLAEQHADALGHAQLVVYHGRCPSARGAPSPRSCPAGKS